MANYKGHILGGLGSGIIVVSALNLAPGEWLPSTQDVLGSWQTTFGLVAISVLAALWPDVDTNSKAQNIFYGVGIVLNIILILGGFFVLSALLGLLAMTPIVGKHRGWTHSKLAAVLVPLPLVTIPWLSGQDIAGDALLVYIIAVSGYFSHLLLDGLIWKKIRLRSSWGN